MEAKKLLALMTILFLFSEFYINLSFAQTNETTTTTTTPAISLPQLPTTLKDVYNLFASINPFFLLIVGLILLVLTHLGKYVAIILIIFALIQIVLLFIH